MNKLTNAQKEYFKDSVVRDKEGNLIPMYHGTPNTFNTFSYSHIGTNGTACGAGFNFTSNRKTAEFYMKESDVIVAGISDGVHIMIPNTNKKQEGEGMLVEAYLNITKPLSSDEITLTTDDIKNVVNSFANKYDLEEECINNINSKINEYINENKGTVYASDNGLIEVIKESIAEESMNNYWFSEEFYNEHQSFFDDIYDNEYEVYKEEYGESDPEGEWFDGPEFRDYYPTMIADEVMEEIQSLGYDGFIGHSFGGYSVYTCLYPNQIKSVTNLYPTKDDNFIDNSKEYFKEHKTSTLDEKLNQAKALRDNKEIDNNLFKSKNDLDR